MSDEVDDQDDWEPVEEDLEDIVEEDDDDIFDLDDVEDSVTGANIDDEDYDEDDDIDYVDEDDESIEEEEDEDGIDEEDLDIDEEDLDGIDEEDETQGVEVAAELSADDEMAEIKKLLAQGKPRNPTPEELDNPWWEEYGAKSEADFFTKPKLEAYKKEMRRGWKKGQGPEEDFWDDEMTFVPLDLYPEANDEDDDEEEPLDEEALAANKAYNDEIRKVIESSNKRQARAKLIAEAERLRAEQNFATSSLFNMDEESDDADMDKVVEMFEQAGFREDDENVEVDEETAELLEAIDALELPEDLQEQLDEQDSGILDEPWVGEGREDIMGTGISDEDMAALDESYRRIEEVTSSPETVGNAIDRIRIGQFDGDIYPRQYHYDMQKTAVEIGSGGYDVYPWLKYDMAFNVSNLVLAAVKHNPDAPVILAHWYPQLSVCERYQEARDRNFDFTWDDVEKANITELEVYYKGFGYDEIPLKAPSETGLTSMEDADEQEVKMAAMEKWMLDVYNSEWDRKDFDDEDIKNEDNVFSAEFKMPQHPDLPSWDDAQEDIAEWKAEQLEANNTSPEAIEYRDMMGQSLDYENVCTPEFEKNFRGHLIVACGNYEEDIFEAERITKRFEKHFGEEIYVETKIYQHAMPDDNVFEVWLESFEIDLLHSKRRAMMGVDGWEGQETLTDERLEYLVHEVDKLTNEDARLSFRWSEELIS